MQHGLELGFSLHAAQTASGHLCLPHLAYFVFEDLRDTKYGFVATLLKLTSKIHALFGRSLAAAIVGMKHMCIDNEVRSQVCVTAACTAA